MSRKKHSKIEKQFYSEKNFKLLEEVLSETLNIKQIKDYQSLIFKNMEFSFKKNPSPILNSKEDRNNFLKRLNKTVLTNIVSQLKPSKQQRPNSQMPPDQKNHLTPLDFLPPPQSSFGVGKMNDQQFSKFEMPFPQETHGKPNEREYSRCKC